MNRHLMTGTGAYFYITWGIWLRHCLNGKQDEFDLYWPSKLTSLPAIVKHTGPPAKMNGKANGKINGSANGHAKKDK